MKKPPTLILLLGGILSLLPIEEALAQDLRLDQIRGMLPLDAELTQASLFLDCDRDGDLDLVLANRGVANRLYRNNGLGSFTDATSSTLPGDSDFTHSLACGDVDGDGDLDLVYGNGSGWGSQSRLLLADGSGVFTDVTGTHLPVDSESTRTVAFADLDQDGDLDLLLGNGVEYGGAQQNRIYLNDGSGHFVDATSARLPAWPDETCALGVGDLDGDGDLDLYFGNVGRNRLLLNDGQGVFQDVSVSYLPPDSEETKAVSVADVDGDGDLDVLAGNGIYSNEQSRLYLNDGSGRLADATSTHLSAGPAKCRVTLLTDLDADGDPDCWMGLRGQDVVLANDGTGRFFPSPGLHAPVDPGDTHWASSGDLDADGDADLVLARVGQNRLLLNSGAGEMVDVTTPGFPADADDSRACLLHDLDGDGDPDLVFGNDGQDRLYRNRGDGSFEDVTAVSFPVDGSQTAEIAVGDVDADGDPDLLIGCSGGHPNRLYRNDGSSFQDITATNLPPDSDWSNGVSLSDIDGDGDLDAVIGNHSPQSRLYRNDGTGIFTDMTAGNMPPGPYNVSCLAVSDVNLDGLPDLFFGSFGLSPASLFLNSGSGAFLDFSATNLPVLDDLTKHAAFGDVDGDGDLDLLLAGMNLHGLAKSATLLSNDGAGIFQDVTATSLPAISGPLSAVVLEDFDGDGDLDAFLGGGDLMLENDGAGMFTDVSSTALPRNWRWATRAAASDLDFDGDIDLVLAYQNDASNRVYFSLQSQLAIGAAPRIGRDLTLNLWGPPGGRWALAACRSRTFRPMPPQGVLLADPRTRVLSRAGRFDATGRAAAAFQVPAASSLIGTSFYWQAVTGPPQRLSNLEITTLTSL
ncbi:MAG: VCBS repeat-containing protein [Planctomycetes bacterium]|nr:VCBS repeat-containing protein [Planctomycetota bacterium]MBL7008813.1 VCBS repeat-containing protein [Planctomycetota bacterium]